MGRGLFYTYWHEHSNKVDSFFAAVLNHWCCIHQLNSLNQSNIYCSRRELKFCSWILPPSWVLYFFLKYFLVRNRFLNFRSKFWGGSNIILLSKQVFKCLANLRPKCQSWNCYKICFSYLWRGRWSRVDSLKTGSIWGLSSSFHFFLYKEGTEFRWQFLFVSTKSFLTFQSPFHFSSKSRSAEASICLLVKLPRQIPCQDQTLFQDLDSSVSALLGLVALPLSCVATAFSRSAVEQAHGYYSKVKNK